MKLSIYLIAFISTLLFSCSTTKPAAANKNEADDKEEIDLEYLLIKGEGYYVIGSYVKALDYFNKALELDPDNATLHYKIGETLFLMEDPRAVTYARKAVELDKSNPTFYVVLADIYDSKLEYKKEAQTYEALLENNPEQFEYYYDLADIYSTLGQEALRKKVELSLSTFGNKDQDKEIKKMEEEVTFYFDQALRCFDKIEEYYGPSEELIRNKQWIYLRQGKVDKAIEEGDILIKNNPDDITYKIHQVEILYSNKREDEALERLKVIQKDYPNNADVLLLLYDFKSIQDDEEGIKKLLAQIFDNPNIPISEKVKRLQPYFTSFDETATRKFIEKQIHTLTEIHPEEPISYTLKGDFYSSMDSISMARDAYYRSLKIDPDNYELWQQVIAQDMSLSQTDSLLKHCKEALDFFPNQPIIWLYQGVGYSMKKEYKEAVAALEHGKMMTGDDLQLESSFNAQLGDSYNGLEEYSKSDEAYEAALAYDPNNAHVLNNYSYFLSLRKDQLTKAEAMCEKLMIMYPNDPTYLDTYGWVLYQMGNYEKAEVMLYKAVIESNSGTILEHYGDVLFKLDRKDEALQYWKKAQKAGQASDLIDKKIANNFLYE